MPLGLPALPGVVETNDRCITVVLEEFIVVKLPRKLH